MPLYLGNIEINKEYVDSYGLGEIYLGTQLIQGSNNPNPFIRATATNASITFSGDYKIYTFSTIGTSSFDILSLGTNENNLIEYLVIAGGGAGGIQTNGQGLGGGAGGMLTGSYIPLSIGVNSIIVGAGGIGTNVYSYPTSGSNSSALGFTSYGGGTGGNSVNFTGPTDGGSGAGLRSGIAGQGNDGGTFYVPGGGGAGQAGQNGTNSAPLFAGDGGDGLLNSITGTSLYYAGGGAGGGVGGDANNRTPGIGGVGGGGNGGDYTGDAVARSGKDATFYGGGGGGIGDFEPGLLDDTYSGDGYQGVVILRHKYK